MIGEAGAPGQDTWIRFHLRVADGVVKDARFQAYGCPHTLAVAAWMAKELPGRRREALQPGTPTEWAKIHGVPTEKFGRLLVVEDAVRACLRHWPGRA
ncbi:MAG: iron-sulfur cluster assembly scaffold protein [Steroidobacteraceae bacterium]